MARKVRIEFAGAVYHLMSRGNQGQAIFRGDPDRKLFLDTLADGCEKAGWQVHAYLLMGNHYHVQVEMPEANLVAGMKWIANSARRSRKPSTHLAQTRQATLCSGANLP